jgi:hypothetical protein
MTSFGSDRDLGPGVTDVGIQATERLKEKRTAVQKALRTFKFVVWGCVLVVVLGIAGLAWWAYEHRESGYVTDERSCSLEIGKRSLTGTRAYSYHYNTYLGWRVVDTSIVEEKTTFQVRGSGFIVINLYDGKSDVTRVGMGEMGVQVLKKADRYVFVMDDGSVGVSDYRSLCK